MPVAPVTLAESLRPWSYAGITHFLADSPLDLSQAEKPIRPRPGLAPASGGQRARRFHPREAPAAPPASAQPILPSAAPGPPALSPLWQAMLAKTPAAPIAWTYAELGLDLGGAGSPERGRILRELIQRLRLPKGSSAFWPFKLRDENGAYAATPQMFQAGLDRLKPRALIFFGPADLTQAGFPNLDSLPYVQHMLAGRLLITLPDINALQTDTDKLNSVFAYLRTFLANLNFYG